MPIRIMIADDQRLMREGLKTILELENDIQVIGLAENGRDLLDIIEIDIPDVILLDIRMPVMDGVECTKQIKQKCLDIKVLILTTFDDDDYIIEALSNGADGYLLKDLSAEKLISSIRDLYHGNAILQPEIAAKLVSHITRPQKKGSQELDSRDELTDREKEVLTLVARGMGNREIANALFISEGTVKNYISSIYNKLQISDRAKAVLYAIEHKYI